MVALATIDDLAAVMARDLSDSDLERCTTLLDIASQRVRTHTGQTFTKVTTTDVLRVRNKRVKLPQRPVVSVGSVTDLNDITVGFDRDGLTVLDLARTPVNAFEIEPRRTGLRTVKVTYTHGYDPIPADVIGVVCDLAAAALDTPPEQSGVQSETLGPFSMSSGSKYPGVLLTQAMKDSLAPYTAPVGTAQVS